MTFWDLAKRFLFDLEMGYFKKDDLGYVKLKTDRCKHEDYILVEKILDEFGFHCITVFIFVEKHCILKIDVNRRVYSYSNILPNRNLRVYLPTDEEMNNIQDFIYDLVALKEKEGVDKK